MEGEISWHRLHPPPPKKESKKKGKKKEGEKLYIVRMTVL